MSQSIENRCECGADITTAWRTQCEPCRKAGELKRERELFAAAAKVQLADYDGVMVATADDELFESTKNAAGLHESLCFLAEDGSLYVWGTYPVHAAVKLEDELEQWLEEHHEDAADWVDHAKLEAAQKLVDEALADVVTYYQDEKTAVILPPREVEE